MKMTKWLKQQKQNRREAREATRQIRPLHEPFVLEILEDRILLSATPMEAVVTTDKADYSPGETAIITTSNEASTVAGAMYADGEMVQFQVTRTDGVQDYPSGNLPWYVVDGVGGFDAYQDTIVDTDGDGVAESGDRNHDGLADWIRPDNDLTVNGSISTTWFVEDQYLGSSLLLTATGQSSGAVATWAFTDGIASGSPVILTTNPVLNVVSGGQVSVPYAFSYETSGSTTEVTWTVSLVTGTGSNEVSYQLASGTVTGLTNGTHYVNSTNASGGNNLSASWTAQGAGTYSLKVTVSASNGTGTGSRTAAGAS